MNSNFRKYALPLVATAVAATVGIWLQPPPTVPSTSQSIADFKRASAPGTLPDECAPQAGEPSGTGAANLDDLLHDCGERPQ